MTEMITLEQRTEIRPFKASDMVWLLEDGVKELGLRFLPDEQIDELARAREENGQCITGLVDGQIVGCGGIDLLWPGVGEVWVILSYEINRYPMRVYEVIRNGLKELIENNNLKRTQAWCRKDFVQGITMMKHLGFEIEGIARCYAPDGMDCFLYSIIKDIDNVI